MGCWRACTLAGLLGLVAAGASALDKPAVVGEALISDAPRTSHRDSNFDVADGSLSSREDAPGGQVGQPRIAWPALAPEDAFEPVPRKPGFLETVTNEAGYRLTRLGGSRQEMTSKVPLPPGARFGERHRVHWYSRSSAASATGRYAISYIRRGLAALWRLRPAPDFVAWLTFPGARNNSAQVIWDKSEDEALWWTRSNQVVRTRFDAHTFAATHVVVHTFAGYATVTFGAGEGDISADGSKVALMARRPEDAEQGGRPGDAATWLIAYDIAASAVVGERRLDGDIDSLSVDPTGSWLVWTDSAARERRSVPWSDLHATPFVFERQARHGDFVVDRDGTVWFATTRDGITLWRVDRDNDEGIRHWSVGDSDGHISGIDNAPGKFIYTRYNGGQIILFDVAQPHRQAVIGYTRHCETNQYGGPNSYRRQPRGSAAADGRYVIFASEWCRVRTGSPSERDLPDMYVIELPLDDGE